MLTMPSGVYDIHSPRVPVEDEFKQRIQEMLQYRKSSVQPPETSFKRIAS